MKQMPKISSVEKNWNRPASTQQDWQKLFEKSDFSISGDEDDEISSSNKSNIGELANLIFQSFNNQYLIAVGSSALILVERQAAHERVLFDRFAALSAVGSSSSQRRIFPDLLEFSAPDAELISELLPDLLSLGFEIIPLKNNEFEVVGAPPDLADEPLTQILEGMLDFYKLNKMELRIDKRKNLILSMAKNLSIRPGQHINNEEISALMNALSESALPFKSPSGKTIIVELSLDDIVKFFKS
jgi:DNA mismatch repair protein MutL